MTSPKRSQGSKPSATEDTDGLTPPDGPTDLIVACADESSESRAVRRGRPSAAEAEQIVGRILEASWDVLLAEGFEGFTFDRVARHAHIGKATIYSRFANKRELMGALLRYRIEAQHAHISATGADLPPIEAFTARSTEVLSLLLSPDGILQERLIDWMDQEGDGECGEVRTAIYRHSLVAIEALIHKANATGLVHIHDPAAAAEFWLEGLVGHARVTRADENWDRAAHERWSHKYVHFFFSGVATNTPDTIAPTA
ncbi:TetR/AcrR family transcriptional regulator [Novosphingobium sp. EMRT-2]|uniref:TetR/AcrR family transcriptional regulator n=1 Tax=Novosphingobium sp. EMRT-2 TaxID=2571749 RepID=UPI00210790F3|nr:TetR/AcrR family transcriptional regulator [Novosphingobium sp. EMRT-2]